MSGKSRLYVNVHAHRVASVENELVITNIRCSAELKSDFHSLAYYSAGVHPWDIEKKPVDSCLKQIRDMAGKGTLIAIGETGLDKAINTPFEMQYQVFEEHINLAEEFQIPVIIHAVKSNQELIQLRKVREVQIPFILHGFSGSSQLAMDLINAGYYLSAGNAVLHSKKLQDAVKIIPPESLFIETDDSDIAVAALYKFVALIKKIPEEELCDQILENFNSVFKKR